MMGTGMETPLETARRIWPGKWDCADHGRTLVRLLGEHQGARLAVHLTLLYPGHTQGAARIVGDGWYTGAGPLEWYIGTGPLEDVLRNTREQVQAMARDFAHAAGLAVQDDAQYVEAQQAEIERLRVYNAEILVATALLHQRIAERDADWQSTNTRTLQQHLPAELLRPSFDAPDLAETLDAAADEIDRLYIRQNTAPETDNGP